MPGEYFNKYYYGTSCHVYQFKPTVMEFDVTQGNNIGKLEKLSTMKGEPKPNQRLITKINGTFFAMNGTGGDTYSSLVDEGKYYHGSSEYLPTLIFWKDNTMSVEHNPDQSRHSIYQRDAHWASGVVWTLLINGKADYTYSKSTLIKVFGHPYYPNPRTMIGRKPDGTIVLVVTDGRGTGSRGLTITEQSDVMLWLGCTFAVNLDGGGSSEMVINGKIVNKLQGGVERYIGTAFCVYENIDEAVDDPSNILAKGRVFADTLNVRSGAGVSYDIIGSLSYNSTCSILEKATNGWYKIVYGDNHGWVSGKYVIISEAESSSGEYKTTTANLWHRLGRGTDYGKIQIIPKGTKIRVTECADEWCKVSYNNKEGYCSSIYLK